MNWLRTMDLRLLAWLMKTLAHRSAKPEYVGRRRVRSGQLSTMQAIGAGR